MKPPARFKSEDQLDGDEVLETIQAERSGEDRPRFETREFREFRADVLRAGGLHDEADDAEPGQDRPLEELSAAEHLERMRRGE